MKLAKFSLVFAALSLSFSILATGYLYQTARELRYEADRMQCELIWRQRTDIAKRLPNIDDRAERERVVNRIYEAVPGIVRDGKDVCNY